MPPRNSGTEGYTPKEICWTNYNLRGGLPQDKEKMPIKKNEEAFPEPQTQITLTNEQLQALLAAATAPKGENDKFGELVHAIIESRKPYVDPRTEANEEEFRRGAREQERNRRAAQANAENNCPHEKGSTGNRSYGESAFWILRLDTGLTIGVCSQCGKTINSLNPDHTVFFRKRGDNLPATAGQGRVFLDPIKAMTASFSPEERKETLDRIAKGL